MKCYSTQAGRLRPPHARPTNKTVHHPADFQVPIAGPSYSTVWTLPVRVLEPEVAALAARVLEPLHLRPPAALAAGPLQGAAPRPPRASASRTCSPSSAVTGDGPSPAA